MKKFSEFLEKAATWKIFLFGWLLTSIIVFIMSFIFFGDKLTYNLILFSGVFGLLFGGMFTSLISMGRASQKFWDKAKEVEKLIDEATTKEDLVSIFNNDFQSLKKLSLGNPHGYELRRIYTILETKHKYIK